MVFTSVAGHLLELEFEPRVKGWHSCAPRDLYDASVHKGVPKVGPAAVQSAIVCAMPPCIRSARGTLVLHMWLCFS